MLEKLNFLFFISFFPLIFIELIVLFSCFKSTSRKNSKLIRLSVMSGYVVGVLVAIFSLATFFKGNFLAPLVAVLFAPIFGGIAAILTFFVGGLILIIYNTFQSIIAGSSHSTTALPSVPFPLSLFCQAILIAIVLITEGYFLNETKNLQKRYGDVMRSAGPLSEAEIREAYGNFVFRNHNLLLRGLLMRKNVPSDIVAQIYIKSNDQNVIAAALAHPNAPADLINSQ